VLRLEPLAPNAYDGPTNILYLLGESTEPSTSNTSPTTFLQLDALFATSGDDAVTTFLSGPARAGLNLEQLNAVWLAEPQLRAQAIRDYVAEHDILNRTVLVSFALLAARLGEAELAVEILRKSFIELDGFAGYWFVWARTLSETRRTQAFRDFLRDLGLVDFWRETGEWGDFCMPIGDQDFECV
jgi:hypothetical protein